MDGHALEIVVPPFTSIDYPSLQAGLAFAGALEAGLDVGISFLNRELADQFGHDAYSAIASLQRSLGIGEWISAALLNDDREWPQEVVAARRYPDFGAYLASEHGLSDEEVALAFLFRQEVARFIDERVARFDPRTRLILLCCAHQQTSFSLALSKKIKASRSDIKTVLFGSSVEFKDVAEQILATFSFVDGVFERPPAAILRAHPRRS